MRGVGLITLAALLGGCATTPQGLPPVMVTATAQTTPVGGVLGEDAADDPAIWRNAANPAASLIVATDKKAGLYVYGMDGAARDFAAAGEVNNVDLAEVPGQGVIVVTSDRNDLTTARIRVYRLDTASGRLTDLGISAAGPGESYGLCVTVVGGQLRSFLNTKAGHVYEQALTVTATGHTAAPLRTLKVATQPEGCVVDHRNQTLYLGEEDVGIWRFAADQTDGVMVAPIDNNWLVADVEGLALAPEGAEGGYLIASSQGDHTYAVFELPTMTPRGRFAIGAGVVGSVEETDGIDLALGSFGTDYPEGLFVAQDGFNQPSTQNFKLVSWAAVKAALGLD